MAGVEAHRHQKVDAGERRRPCAGGDEPHLAQLLALQHEAVADGGGDDDGGAVLVVVEHRDAHAAAQLGLDREAFRGLDVFQVDRAEGRLQGRDHVAEAGGVGLVHLDVEHVDAGELLEQDGLALHHRLAGERADVAEAEHGGAVGDHAHEVAARGVFARRIGIFDDRLAGGGDAWRVGECEVALRRHALGRLDRELPGPWQAVVVERRFAEVVVHRPSPRRAIERRLSQDARVRRRRRTALLPRLVRSRRLELPRGCPHQHLKLARLPFRHDRTGQAQAYSRWLCRLQ